MRTITYAEALNEALHEEMRKDPHMMMIGEDIGRNDGAFKVTKGLYKLYPDRVIDSPISENAIAGTAYGAAVSGCKAVAEFMFADFSIIGLDNIVNSAAKFRTIHGAQTNVPVVFRLPGGAGVQEGAQHSQSLEAMYANFPGLKIVTPGTPYDAKGLLKASLNDGNPIVFIEHKLQYSQTGEVPEEEYTVPIGKGIIRKNGSDVTIVATQVCMIKAMEAAKRLSQKGIDAEVIDLRSIVPWDKELVYESVRKTGRLVVSNEAPVSFGISGEICTSVVENCFDYLNAPPVRACGKDVVIPYNKQLEAMCVPQIGDIYAAAVKSMEY